MLNRNTRISLGEISDSNSFRTKFNHVPDLFKVTLEFPEDSSPLRLLKDKVAEAEGNAWRNPSLNDPSNHLPKFYKLISEQINILKRRRILLATSKDQVFMPILLSNAFNFESCTSISELRSDNLHYIDREVKTFSAQKDLHFDLIFLRHSLEHSEHPLELLIDLKRVLSQTGIVVIEVPFCEISSSTSFVEKFWEEHFSYFTIESLKHLATKAGYAPTFTMTFETENEPVIMMILNNASHASPNLIPGSFKSSGSTSDFALVESELTESRKFISSLSPSNPIIFLGANHKTINFIDLFFESASNIVIVDGDENKIGKYSTKHNIEIQSFDYVKHLRNQDVFTTINSIKIEYLKDRLVIPNFLHDSIINIYETIRHRT